MDRMRIK